MSFLFSPFGKESNMLSPAKQSNLDEEAHKIISKLVSTLQASSILADKRDILKNIHGYSKKFPSILASFGFDCYFDLFHSEVQDSLTIGLALQTILAIIQASQETADNFLAFLKSRVRILLQIFVSFEYDQLICEYLLQILSTLSEKNLHKTIDVVRISFEQIADQFCLFVRGESDILFVEAANLLTKWSFGSQELKHLLIFRSNIHLFIGDFLEKSSLNKVRYETIYLLELIEAILHEHWEYLNSTDCTDYVYRLCKIFIRELNEQQKLAPNWSSSTCKNYVVLLNIFQNSLINSVVPFGTLSKNGFDRGKLLEKFAFLLEPLANLSLQFTSVSHLVCTNSLALISLIVKESESNAHMMEKIIVCSTSGVIPTPFLLTLANLLLNEKCEIFSVQLKMASLLVMNSYLWNKRDVQLGVISTLIPTPEGTVAAHGKSPLANETIGSLLLKALFDFSPQPEIQVIETLQSLTESENSPRIITKPFLASLLLSFIIHTNPSAIQKASSFPVTVDFLHEFNVGNSEIPVSNQTNSLDTNESNHEKSSSFSSSLVPTIPQNILLALSNLSSSELQECTKIGYVWLLCEFIDKNPPLTVQLLEQFNLGEYLKQNQDEWSSFLFAIVLNSYWNENDNCSHLISCICPLSHKPILGTFQHLSKLSIPVYLSTLLPQLDNHLWLLKLFEWPTERLLSSSIPDGERILLGQRPLMTYLEGKLRQYQLDCETLKDNMENLDHNKNALLKRVSELEDEQQQFLERIGSLEEQVQRLKKNAKMSDILSI